MLNDRFGTYVGVGLGCLLLACNPTTNPPGPTDTQAPDVSAPDTPDVSAPDTAVDPVPFAWTSTGLASEVPDYTHTTVMEQGSDGSTVMVAFSDGNAKGYFGAIPKTGGSWKWTELTGINQAKALLELPNGDLLIGGSSVTTNLPILKKSIDGGLTWKDTANAGPTPLPSVEASTLWDLKIGPQGTVAAALTNSAAAPSGESQAIWISTDSGKTFSPTAPLPGSGAMSVLFKGPKLFATTTDSDDHDDPSLAGQARLFVSDDLGTTWTEGAVPTGANRIYNLTAIGPRIYACSGVSARLMYTEDEGASWKTCGPVPEGDWYDPAKDQTFTEPATRVYNIIRLTDGRLFIGTGARTGDVFTSSDNCETWDYAGDTGDNIVTWGLTQTSDGTLWIGTGSKGGDVYTTSP